MFILARVNPQSCRKGSSFFAQVRTAHVRDAYPLPRSPTQIANALTLTVRLCDRVIERFHVNVAVKVFRGVEENLVGRTKHDDGRGVLLVGLEEPSDTELSRISGGFRCFLIVRHIE